MTAKSTQLRTKTDHKSVSCGSNDIIIPELEEAIATYTPKGWTEQERAILIKYYNKVDIAVLMKHIPNHTKTAIQNEASHQGLTGRRVG